MKHLLSFLDRPLIRRADALRDECRWDEAIILYRRIAARSPHRAGVWVQMGHCLRKIAKPAEALMAYQAADRHRPDDADTMFNLAHLLRQYGRSDEAQSIFDRIISLDGVRADILRATLLAGRHEGETPDRFDNIIIGTTGTCNASCVHCPTGKLSTATSPRFPMPMKLFRKIVDEIADSGMPIAGQIAFGLFGDGLVDPFVVERARYLRARLPEVCFDINTNGAAYDPAKHAELNDHATVLTLHCESLIPEIYDYLMQPLRAKRVHAKFPMIFRDFPNKVSVAVPMSRLNIDERPAILDFFYKLGAINVDFTPISNRLANDEKLFDEISFAPSPIACSPAVLYNLIVDCDGTVLACCNDFGRAEPIGNLATDSLAETLAHQRRKAFGEKLASHCHNDLATCGRCRGDLPQSIPPIDPVSSATA